MLGKIISPRLLTDRLPITLTANPATAIGSPGFRPAIELTVLADSGSRLGTIGLSIELTEREALQLATRLVELTSVDNAT